MRYEYCIMNRFNFWWLLLLYMTYVCTVHVYYISHYTYPSSPHDARVVTIPNICKQLSTTPITV